MKITHLQPITNKDTALARKALRVAGIKATVRKGKGSCYCQMTVTPKDGQCVVETLENVGFTLDYVAQWGSIYFNKI